MKQPPFAWPDGKRVAISVMVLLETWSEGKAPAYSIQTTALKPGAVDYSGATWSQYGGRVGVWRVIRALDHFRIRGTFFASAKSAELYPEAIAQMVKSGHDIAGHGITQDQLLVYLTPEEQLRAIRESLDTIERASGKRPEGWASPVLAWTPDTIGFLAREGVQWYGDTNYVDLPIRIRTEHGDLIGIPCCEFADNRVLRGSPRDFYDVYKDTFDYLYRHEPTSMLVLAIHCHWGGRPPIMAIFHQLFEYFATFPDVWLTSHGEIARWVKSQGVDEVTYAQRYFAE